jgi:transcriptional regulator with XRE-family HTH domain
MLKLRTAIGLTQGRLADYLGVSGRAVRGWEAGVSYPNAERLKALIALAVQQQAFTVGHESEEIRVFWKVARPKMLLDEDWLCTLLEHSSSPQDKETVGGVPCVDPEPPPSAHPLSPLPSMSSLEDGTSSTTPTTSQPLESGTTGVPLPSVEDELVQGDGSAQGDELMQGDVSAQGDELIQRNELMQGMGSAQGTIPTVGKRGGRRRLLIPILIALVLVTIVASAGTLFFHLRNGTTTQVNKTVTDQAYPGYLSGKGTLAFFDPLSQEEGKWKSGAGSSCQFIGGAYHVSTQQWIDSFSWCFTDDIFSNFAIEVQLTIIQGDCGGITFRDDFNGNFYRFIICQDGTYRVSKYISASSPKKLRRSNSSAIRVGLGQQNKMAVVASGSTMTFYVNERQVGQVEDSSYNSGQIALIASPLYSHVTDVAYSNAKLWRL